MTELRPLSPAEAARGLRRAGTAARGFLGTDPVTQNDALLVRELTRREAQVYAAGGALVGCVPNRAQPRQAYVSSTSAGPEPVRALLEHLAGYQRRTSFVALVSEDGTDGAAAFLGAGFARTGVLPGHRYAGHAFHDVLVLVKEEPCRS
ncbi:hypothetical protein Q5425_33615 [Amycolatopsis sp. A133]|jgi:hypothetical protein|uniref:hypothetical protein n=1 Tax=Amycolatopsis sp. A133 TaxID=3064472 RepID=UPI0027FE527E|nr:hypothetical protein [Amycolatopsis sp. A133]MDQ7808699.1 hypothetical protein [Amycolatopsis sp. A133]